MERDVPSPTMMRFRRILIAPVIYMASVLRNSVSTKYVPLSEESNPTHHRSISDARLFSLLTSNLPFIFGLPLSILLLYINHSIAFVVSFFLLTLAVFLLFRLIENSLVYAPNEPSNSRLLCEYPDKFDFSTWEAVELHPDGNCGPKITGYLILHHEPSVRSTCPTILLLHGNAGNIGHRLPLCRVLYDNLQCNVLLIDYRGFGRSSGFPTERGLFSDARCSLEYLLNRNDIDRNKLFVFGRSIGGAVAIQLANYAAPEGLLRGVIVENSFTSLPEAAQHVFSKSFGSAARYILPSWMFVNRYNSLERLHHLERFKVPKFLFISGEDDELIPPKMMRDLASAQRGSRSISQPEPTDPESFIRCRTDGLVVFPGGQHNTTWLCPDWINVVSHFIRKTCDSSAHD